MKEIKESLRMLESHREFAENTNRFHDEGNFIYIGRAIQKQQEEIKQLKDALLYVKTGLEWFLSEYPESKIWSDDEIMDKINRLLSNE